MINQLNNPVVVPQQQQEFLIQEGAGEGMTEEEFEQLQAALVASMG